MKKALILFAVALMPTLSIAGAKSPASRSVNADRVVSSSETTEKKDSKKCRYGEQQLADGSCERINEPMRPMRPDRN